MDQADRKDWNEFRAGRQDGLERIYARHKNRMYTYCLYTTGDHAMSEDLVQQAFARLIQNKTSLDAVDSVRNWLFICVRNLTLNALKGTKRRSELRERLAPPSVEMDVETRRLIDDVLGRLSESEREFILMREQQGYSVGEIAAMADMTETAVRVRLYRIRKKMQQIARGRS